MTAVNRRTGSAFPGRQRNALRLAAMASLVAFPFACGSGPTESHVSYEPSLPDQGLNIAGGPVAVADLYHSFSQTVKLVRVEEPIGSHRHMHSEETVYVVSGQGILHRDGADQTVRAGDLVVVPRNTLHGYTPTGDEPAVVLSIFTPAFQHGDRVLEEVGDGPESEASPE